MFPERLLLELDLAPQLLTAMRKVFRCACDEPRCLHLSPGERLALDEFWERRPGLSTIPPPPRMPPPRPVVPNGRGRRPGARATTAQDVERMAQLRAQGLSCAKIGARFGGLNPSVVQYHLNRRALTDPLP